MANENDRIEEISSRSMTDEEHYYYELSYKDPAETTTRIEETAKFLIGITSATSGLYLSACKLAMGKATVSSVIWFG